MRAWQFLSTRNPLWRIAGFLVTAGAVGVTLAYVARGPRPLAPTNDAGNVPDTGTQGRFGTVKETLDKGLFVLSYDTISGSEEDLELRTVKGRLEELKSVWDMDSPLARKSGGMWTLYGPMDVRAVDPATQAPLGQGRMAGPGPALGWDKGVWHGLSPLVWNDLRGGGRGRWDLPAGWYRGLDGRFVVEHGPVHWTATQEGVVKTLEAERLWMALGFNDGHLEQVTGQLTGGQIRAQVVDVTEQWINWTAPVSFARDDGWHGDASGGRAPRPPEGGSFQKVELRDFRALRAIEGGTESVKADGARWTPAGLRLEGNVRLEQPLEGKRLLLQAPRVMERAGAGADLPADLPLGETWAESQAVLTWGPRSLSSPRIEARRRTRQWHLLAPALGRSEMGTFSAGEGHGDPARWEFQGPILAHFVDGSTAQGDSLVWENNLYTFAGRPVTVIRIRERLTGPRVLRREDVLEFPYGVAGALAALDGDITIRADKGRAQRTLVNLDGRVECQGQGWNLQADHISVTLGAGNMVKQVNASGGVYLGGRLGEGKGDALVLDPNQKTVTWAGRVKAVTEVRP